jgi:hypothetical protein
MRRTDRTERLGGLVVSAAVIAAFAGLWVIGITNDGDQLTAQDRLGRAVNLAVLGTPSAIAPSGHRASGNRAGGPHCP